LIGSYVFVIGYSAADARLPDAFMKHLLGGHIWAEASRCPVVFSDSANDSVFSLSEVPDVTSELVTSKAL
jgi:hypothetical protein